MPVTLERRSSWMSLLLAIAGVAGVSIAAVAWVSYPHREEDRAATAAPAAAAPTPDGKIHVPLFVEPNQVRPTPRFRFTFDPPDVLAPLRLAEKLDDVIAGATNDMDRALMVMHWTRRQWEPGIPNPYPPLDARVILADIRRGFTGGFHAQYSYVLAQSLQSLGIASRYVSLVDHQVIEALLPDERRWVCLDPHYDTAYRDERGTPLSVLEVHRSLLDGRQVRLDEGARVSDPKSHLEAFRSFAVWLKNDHISSPVNFADLERYKVRFLDEAPPAGAPAGTSLWTTEPVDLYPQ